MTLGSEDRLNRLRRALADGSDDATTLELARDLDTLLHLVTLMPSFWKCD